MIDLRDGDKLVVDDFGEYSVQALGMWSDMRMDASGAVMCTTTAEIWRRPMVNNKRGDWMRVSKNISCTPVDPVSPEMAQRLQLGTPYKNFQVVLMDGDSVVEVILQRVTQN